MERSRSPLSALLNVFYGGLIPIRRGSVLQALVNGWTALCHADHHRAGRAPAGTLPPGRIGRSASAVSSVSSPTTRSVVFARRGGSPASANSWPGTIPRSFAAYRAYLREGGAGAGVDLLSRPVRSPLSRHPDRRSPGFHRRGPPALPATGAASADRGRRLFERLQFGAARGVPQATEAGLALLVLETIQLAEPVSANALAERIWL